MQREGAAVVHADGERAALHVRVLHDELAVREIHAARRLRHRLRIRRRAGITDTKRHTLFKVSPVTRTVHDRTGQRTSQAVGAKADSGPSSGGPAGAARRHRSHRANECAELRVHCTAR